MLIPVREEICPFEISLCFLYFKKSDTTRSNLQEMELFFTLKTMPLCQTLSNAFEVSRKTSLTFREQPSQTPKMELFTKRVNS